MRFPTGKSEVFLEEVAKGRVQFKEELNSWGKYGMEMEKWRENSGPSCLRSQESRKMALCECGGNEASQTHRGMRLEPERGWRLQDQ